MSKINNNDDSQKLQKRIKLLRKLLDLQKKSQQNRINNLLLLQKYTQSGSL